MARDWAVDNNLTTKDIHPANVTAIIPLTRYERYSSCQHFANPFPPRLLALALGVWLGPESPERLSRWNTF